MLRRLTTLLASTSNRSITITRKSSPTASIFKRGYRYAAHLAQTGVSSLINARWVIPVVPENKVLEHHTVAVDNAGKDRKQIKIRLTDCGNVSNNFTLSYYNNIKNKIKFGKMDNYKANKIPTSAS